MPPAGSLTSRPKKDTLGSPKQFLRVTGAWWLNGPEKRNSSPLLLAHAVSFRRSLPGVRTDVKQFLRVITFFFCKFWQEKVAFFRWSRFSCTGDSYAIAGWDDSPNDQEPERGPDAIYLRRLGPKSVAFQNL
jgi:hypothetical protein